MATSSDNHSANASISLLADLTKVDPGGTASGALQGDAAAWSFLEAQPPGYQRTARWWIMQAKRDETRLKRTERAIEAALLEAQDQATRDALTGLHNRRFVEMVLPSELARAQRHEVPLSLCVLDVDHFKQVNDRHGHPVGDLVLVRLATAMQRMRRVSDTCARIGGEEFCLLLPHTGRAAAETAAERVHRVVRALRFEEVPGLRVTVSIGIATTKTLAKVANKLAKKNGPSFLLTDPWVLEQAVRQAARWRDELKTEIEAIFLAN